MERKYNDLILYSCGLIVLVYNSFKGCNVHLTDFTTVLVAYAVLLAALCDIYGFCREKRYKKGLAYNIRHPQSFGGLLYVALFIYNISL